MNKAAFLTKNKSRGWQQDLPVCSALFQERRDGLGEDKDFLLFFRRQLGGGLLHRDGLCQYC